MAQIKKRRKYERIDVDLGVRLFVPGGPAEAEPRFEAFAQARNLCLGGVFVECTFLLKEGAPLWVELHLPEKDLALPGRVAHAIGLQQQSWIPGMGVQFLAVDAEARESLMRFFTPERYRQFYGDLMVEFPHLEPAFAPASVSLLLNLWEEWKIKAEGGSAATDSGAPGPLPIRGGRH